MSLIIVRTLSNPFRMWNDTTTPQNIAVPQQRINLAEVGIMQYPSNCCWEDPSYTEVLLVKTSCPYSQSGITLHRSNRGCGQCVVRH